MSDRALGILLVSIATILWSTAGLFVRMLPLDVWTTLGWRAFFAGATLLLIAFARRRPSTTKDEHIPFYLYILFGFLSGVSMFGYITALKLATVASVLAIYSTVPFVAAGISLLWLKEKIDRRILIASGLALVGVLIVVGFAARIQDIAGAGMSLLMTVAFSVVMVAARRYKTLRLSIVHAIGCGFCIALSLPLMQHNIPSAPELAVLAAFGSSTGGIAYLLFSMGARYIPAGEAGLIGMLDIVLGPTWVWLAFSEDPGSSTLVGGALIIAAVLWYLMNSRKPAPIAH